MVALLTHVTVHCEERLVSDIDTVSTKTIIGPVAHFDQEGLWDDFCRHWKISSRTTTFSIVAASYCAPFARLCKKLTGQCSPRPSRSRGASSPEITAVTSRTSSTRSARHHILIRECERREASLSHKLIYAQYVDQRSDNFNVNFYPERRSVVRMTKSEPPFSIRSRM